MISKRLQEFRDKKGLSQKGMAKIGHMTQRTWGNWEQSPLDAFESIVAIAKHFNVSVDYLLALTDNEMPVSERIEGSLAELTAAIRKLPNYRQRDLLAMAELFAAKIEEDDSQALRIVYEKIVKLGGDEAGEILLKLLGSLDMLTNDPKAITLKD